MFYELGLSAGSMVEVKIEVGGGRVLSKPRPSSLNYQGHTIQQVGRRFLSWSGTVAFDDDSELEFLKSLHAQRSIYIHDHTTGGTTTQVPIYWHDDFRVMYDSPSLESGSVAFRFEEVNSGS